MRLKRIKLAGFKSFVEPTSIPFPGSMTAIVGPNGCGKSNVIDAVRWVLGESSAKNLRGDAMIDVIFNGSSSRKPVGQCSVELVFENTDGRIAGEYANYNELAVKRLVTRDGQSNYYLNSSRCRRRDITDLFLGTGLGPRSYAIIEQGMISRLIESKPQELRVFIEEAAGISKYKERRRETENRIRHTQENLDRLSDVRSELGQQLEKLQRQAAAAQRYTQLKAQERQLKSELAVIRYLALSENINAQDKQLSAAKTEYEGLKARYQGDEAGIERYRETQRELKLKLDDIQQSLFTLATQITRAEEAGQYRQQRQNQISAMLQQLADKLLQAEREQATLQEKQQLLEAQREQAEPQLEMLVEQKDATEEHRQQSEEALQAFLTERRHADQLYHQKKQQTQACHGQIQSAMNMQMRTQQRLQELTEEVKHATDEMLIAQSESLAEAKLVAEEAVATAAETVNQAKHILQQHKQQLHTAEQQHKTDSDNLRKHQATIDALEALQSPAPDSHTNLAPLWQKLSVKNGFETQVEMVLAHLGEPLVCDNLPIYMETFATDTRPNGKRVALLEQFTTNKPEGTLAAYVENKQVPLIFTRIHCVENESQCAALLTSLSQDESVLSADGLWLAHDWVVFGAGQLSSGALQRQAKLASLRQDAVILNEVLDQAHQTLEYTQDVYSQAESQLEEAQTELHQAQARKGDVTQRYGLVAMQVEQNAARATKVREDISVHEDLLLQEQEQLSNLAERVEILEAEIFELETQQQGADDNQQKLQEKVNHTRSQYESLTQQHHEIALQLRDLTQQQGFTAQALERVQTQLTDWHAEHETLQAELLELNEPHLTDLEQLQQWLTERAAAEEQQRELQQKLSEVDDWLEKAQRDQVGIQQAMEQQQQVIESFKLEAERYRVKAGGILEQLNETGHTVKQTMEELSEQANEAEWQTKLDATIASLKRLGAVNLAAVDEYNVQSARKQHLDEQDQDLNDALETLQSAIRKIDKETRSRFSATFDQVNNDLKTLFPKVFGGGSAYLALTDDDLLETGVTIMARPPGKKNSTIHLLSGGEKALTALSLVFAIFRLNPAPFCLLDEVDAPLDDANVGRFCNLVSEMSNSVQFIYITHNKIAMEMANHLTGVTMAEPGVSRMVAVDVDEAVSLVQA